jgi:hypothetical protein
LIRLYAEQQRRSVSGCPAETLLGIEVAVFDGTMRIAIVRAGYLDNYLPRLSHTARSFGYWIGRLKLAAEVLVLVDRL